jgi:hypothetical protein
MRRVGTLVRWKSIVGLLAIGVLAFSLTLEGAPTRKEGPRSKRPGDSLVAPRPVPASSSTIIGVEPTNEIGPAPSVPSDDRRVAGQRTENFVLYGDIRSGTLPVAESQVINPYNDFASEMRRRGELIGPYRPQRTGGVAGGGCSFDVECDDCNPCTLDRCVIAQGAPAGTGTCDNPPVTNGLVGECSDGLFCNGIETCQGATQSVPGTCEDIGSGTGSGSPNCTGAQTCDEFQNECVTPCTIAQCSGVSDNAGDPCATDPECPNGTCLLTPAAVCDDLVVCNGTETCGLDGVCEPGTNPCGPGADCTENICTGAFGGPCLTNENCLSGQTCTATGPGCYPGRCCGGGDGLTCTNVNQVSCETASRDWYSTDSGRAHVDDGTVCVEDGMNCPRYTSGIGPQGEFNFDEINVMSDSICRAGDDGGGGFADFVDRQGRRGSFRLGDDYVMVGDPSYVAVTAFRWVGGVEDAAEERVVFEFYDADENFVEDIFFVSGTPNAVRVAFFDPPLTLPTSGFIVGGVANQFAPNGAVRWLSTTDGADNGSNNPNLMWLEDEGHAGPITPAGGSFDFNVDEVPSSGVLAFEFVGGLLAEPPVGSCCDLSTGDCLDNVVEWVCKSGTCSTSAGTCVDSADCPMGETCLKRTFLGVGSLCATCNGESGSNAFAPCRRCDDGAACDDDTDCVEHGGTEECLPNDAFCLAGEDATGGAACEATTTCATGACCNTLSGACTPGQMSCGANEEFLGFGTDCDPSCCRQPEASWTGGDNCEDAIVHQFTVPDPTSLSCNGTGVDCTGNPGICAGDPCLPTQLVAVITGDNSDATSTAENPDSCTFQQFAPNAQPENFDPGWWEGFHIDECALVRIDNCCTDPVHVPQYRVITQDCPCLTSGFIFSSTQARGGPYCADDNLWSQYGPLHPGTYYFPTFSNLSGTFGEYQLHITVEACPEVACCYLACDRDPPEMCPGGTCSEGVCVAGICRVPCSGPDAECSPDTCEPRCDILNQFGCDDLNGVLLGPPTIAESVSACVQNNRQCEIGEDPIGDNCCDPFGEVNCGTCQIGSCCTAPGVCDDNDPGSSMTKEICEDKPGIYNGGLKCHGGFCSIAIQRSCSETADCPANNICLVTTQEANQPNPCPVCEIDNLTSCRFTPQTEAGFGSGIIYTINNDPFRIADDFKPAGTSITSICWNPGFFNFTTGGECVQTCDQAIGATFPDDGWQVTIYPDNGSGLPDEANGETRMIDVQAKEGIPGLRSCVYSGTVSPAITVVEGGCYWIEITGTEDEDGCTPLWQGNISGNRFALQDGDGVYGFEDALADDLTFCLDSGIDNEGPDCGPVLGACCRCPATQGAPPQCSEGTFADCDDIQGRFQFDTATCPGDPADLCPGGPGPHDNCSSRMVVTSSPTDPDEVVVPVDTFCAFTDGPEDVLCEGATAVEFVDDVWYEYIATCDDDLLIDTCSANNNFDSVMQIFVNEVDPTQCGCPGDADIVQLGPCSDANGTECIENTDAAIRIPVQEGECYTVRIGGQIDLLGFSEGVLDLTFSCGVSAPPVAAPPDACGNDFSAAANGAGGERLSRFGCIQSLTPPATAGGGTAIRIGLRTMYNSSGGDPDGANVCPSRSTLATPRPSLSQFEGQVRWLGAPISIVDEASPTPPNYIGVPLVCTAAAAEVRDWSTTALASEFPSADAARIYWFGSEVVPCSVYEVSVCNDPLNEATCSDPILIFTSRSGDSWPSFAPAPGNPGFLDINAEVNKFKGIPFVPGAPPTGGSPEWHSLLFGNVVANYDVSVVNKKVGFLDIGAAVNGYKLIPYGENGPCRGFCSVSSEACTDNDDCAPDGGVCEGTDNCGNECSLDP